MKIRFLHIAITAFLMSCNSIKPPYAKHKQDQIEKERRFDTHRVTNKLFHDLAKVDEIDRSFDGVLLSFETIPKSKISNPGLTYSSMLGKYKLNFDSVFKSLTWNRQNKQTKDILDGNRAIVLTHSIQMFNGEKDFMYNIYQKEPEHWNKQYDLYDSTKLEFLKLQKLLSRKLTEGDYTHIILMSTGWNNQQQKSIFHYNNWLRNINVAAKEEGDVFKPLYVAITWPSFVKRPIFRSIKPDMEYTGVDLFIEQNNADELGITHINYFLWNVLVPLADSHAVPLVLMGHSFGSRLLTRASTSAIYMGKTSDETNNKIDAFLSFQGAYRLSRHLGNGRGSDDSIYALMNPWKQFISTTSKHDKPFKTGRIVTGLFMGHSKVLEQVQDLSDYRIDKVDESGALIGSIEVKKHSIIDCSNIINHHQDVTDVENGRLIWYFIKNLNRSEKI